MGEIQSGKRNLQVDFARAIAILLVVLGHTITSSTTTYEDSVLYNFIWSVQMPLFVLISGYVVKFSSTVDSGKELAKYLVKRTVSYMVPWAVFTFAIQGLLLGKHQLLDIPYLITHMDTTYWFLFVIWVISVGMGIAQWVAGKIVPAQHTIKRIVAMSTVFAMIAAILLGIGLLTDLNLLCIKLIVYYMPFYLCGTIYGVLEEKLHAWKFGKLSISIIVAISCIVYVVILANYSLYNPDDSVVNTILRVIAGFTGCITVCGLIAPIANKASGPIMRGLAYIGQHSLEIYLLHYLALAVIRLEEPVELVSVKGLGLVLVNYLICLVITLGAAVLLNQNSILRRILFGRK